MPAGDDKTRRQFLATVGAIGIGSAVAAAGRGAPEAGSRSGATARQAVKAGSPSFQYNARNTGRTDSPGPSGQPTEQWRVEAASPRVPAAVDGVAYSADTHGGVRARDLASGEQRWQVSGSEAWRAKGSPRFDHTPHVEGGVVYHATPTHVIAHATSGTFLWAVGADRPASRSNNAARTTAPVVAGELVVAGLTDGVYGVDPSTGAVMWKVPMNYRSFGTPAAADGLVYLVRADGYVYALDAATGEIAWRTYFGPTPAFWRTDSVPLATPTVADGVVYVAKNDRSKEVGRVYALDVADGTEVWSAKTAGLLDPRHVEMSAAVADDFVFVTDSPATLNAFDRADGTRRWTYDVGARYGLAPVVAGDTVFPSATDGAVRALDFDGNERWTVEMEGLALSPPLVLDDRVFVARDLSTHIEMVALA